MAIPEASNIRSLFLTQNGLEAHDASKYSLLSTWFQRKQGHHWLAANCTCSTYSRKPPCFNYVPNVASNILLFVIIGNRLIQGVKNCDTWIPHFGILASKSMQPQEEYPPSPHRREDFSLFTTLPPCLQIALALGTEGPGDWYRDLLINNHPHSFYSIYRRFFNIVENWRWPIKAETCSFNCRIYHLFWTSCVSD